MNPLQKLQLAELTPHLLGGLKTMASLVDLRRDEGMEAVLMQVTPEANQRQQQNIRTLISAIRDTENHRLDQHRLEYESSMRKTSEMFTGGIITQCVLLLLVCIVFLRDASYRAQATREIQGANTALIASEVKLKDSLAREQSAARVDFLTGILNRRGFYEISSMESQRSRRYKRPLSLIYVDIDNFKTVNDSMGPRRRRRIAGAGGGGDSLRSSRHRYRGAAGRRRIRRAAAGNR